MTEFLEILTDPAHVAAETVFVLTEVALLTPLVRFLHRRWVRRHDQEVHHATDHD